MRQVTKVIGFFSSLTTGVRTINGYLGSEKILGKNNLVNRKINNTCRMQLAHMPTDYSETVCRVRLAKINMKMVR